MTIMDVEPCGNGSPKVPKFQTIVRSSGSLLISTAWDPESDAESLEQANPSVRVLPPHRQAGGGEYGSTQNTHKGGVPTLSPGPELAPCTRAVFPQGRRRVTMTPCTAPLSVWQEADM